MRRNGDHVLTSSTDLNTFLGCRHASALDYRASILGEPLIRADDDEGMDLVQRRGDEHEAAQFKSREVAAAGEVVWLTEEAMRRGAALILAATRRAQRDAADPASQAVASGRQEVGHGQVTLARVVVAAQHAGPPRQLR